VAPSGRGNHLIDTLNAWTHYGSVISRREKNHLRRGPSTPDLSKSPFTSLDDVQHPKKLKPRLFSSSNQRGSLLYVTGSYVTSLSNVLQSLEQDQIFHQPTVKFRHPPVFSLQRDSAVFTGDHASRRNEEPPEQGKKKRNAFHLPCFSSLGINKLSFHTLRNLRQLSHYLNKA
ncbi:hypothetical protein AVEN_104188-1, partial [Araneus ventricosus]